MTSGNIQELSCQVDLKIFLAAYLGRGWMSLSISLLLWPSINETSGNVHINYWKHWKMKGCPGASCGLREPSYISSASQFLPRVVYVAFVCCIESLWTDSSGVVVKE